MVEYTKINCKLINVQLNKLKKAVKSNEGTSLRLGIKNFNKDEFPHELLLTTWQNTKLRNAINNNLATDIKLSKLIESGGFLDKLLSIADPLMKVAMPLAKNVLPPLGLTAAMSAIDGSIQKKIHGSGVKLIVEQEDMNDVIKIIEALENSGLGNLLTGKGMMRGGEGIVRAGEGSATRRAKGEGSATSRAKGEGAKKPLHLLLSFHPLTNIEISEYYANEPRFNGVYSRNNLPKKLKKEHT